MSEREDLEPLQALFLWRLIFGRGEGWVMDIKPELSAPQRRALEARGFIQVEMRKTEKKSRANYAILLDKSWSWAEAHLDHLMPKSPAGSYVLQLVLARLRKKIASGAFTLADFCSDSAPAAAPQIDTPIAESAPANGAGEIKRDTTPDADLKRRVIAACQHLTEGVHSGRVRLADLRAKFSEIPRPEMDDVLRDLERSETIVVYPLDNPREITASDEAASLPASGNQQRHIVYLKN